ncbi:MAG: serine hydrolase [Gemmatimonadetes bacterium]|nr:serine hydrolase [Gemmatimonadota bacterium]
MAPRMRLDSFPAYVRRQMRAWKVPGVGLGIVRDGKTLIADGYGLADSRRGVEVTADTPFAICSCSKAFTCLVLAMLAEEGVIDWERPVREYLPDFRMQDAFATERMTPRDLVTHRSGLPRHDDVWFGSSADRQTMLRRLRHLQPTADLRTRYQYQNMMYSAAGYLAGVVTDSSWEAQVQTRILDPLGMSSTTMDIASMEASKIAARPHDSSGKKPRQITYRNLDAIGPAGSINSTVTDMLRWISLHLGAGHFEGRRVVNAKTMRSLYQPHMPADAFTFDELQQPCYALGWTSLIYRGHRVVSHSGGIDGFRCRTSLLPDDGIGVVCYTNGTTDLPHQLTWEAIDRTLGLEPLPWASRYRAMNKREQAAGKSRRSKDLRTRVKGTKPSHRLAEYGGVYEHPGYGKVTVVHQRGKLRLSMKGFDVPLKHWHYDVFEYTPPRAEPVRGSFFGNRDGQIGQLSLPLQEGTDDIVFERSEA